MQIYRVILLITGLLIISFFTYWVYSLLNKPPGHHVQPASCDTPDCLGKSLDCNIMKPETITTCVPEYDPKTGQENDAKCYSCFGNMNCQEVTKDKPWPLRLPVGQECKSPYVLEDPNDPTSRCLMPLGNYCLPYDMPKVTCNEFTGRKLLSKAGDHNPYEWLCICVDDTKFTNSGMLESDCDHIRVCSMDGRTNKDPGVRHLMDENGDVWDPAGGMNPFKGHCQCDPVHETPSNKPPLSCVGNQCYPGQPCTAPSCDPNKYCTCPYGFLDCATIGERAGFSTGICPEPSCIPDPCAPGGVYDPSLHEKSGGCNCSAKDGYVSAPAMGSIVGEVCVNWCTSGQNTCGRRGTCVVNVDPKGDTNLNYIFFYVNQGKTTGWLIQSVIPAGDKPYYFSMNNDSLGLDQAGGDFFTIEPDCSDTVCAPVTNLVPNIKYYLKTGQSYINIKNPGPFKTASKKSDVEPWMYVSVDAGNAGGQTGRIFIGDLVYMSTSVPDGSSPNLTVGAETINVPTCTNCIVPYAQDGSKQCAGTCIPDGVEDWLGDCCSCEIRKYPPDYTPYCHGGQPEKDVSVFDKSKWPDGCPS